MNQQDVKTFQQNMNLQDLKNITVQRETPQNITVGQIEQQTLPSFQAPNINNNTVNFDFNSQSS